MRPDGTLVVALFAALTLPLRAGAEIGLHPDLLRGRRVCIDPGHPSETSEGTVGPHGITENHLNWVLARRLASVLGRRGARVVLTKSREDQRVTNRERAEVANRSQSEVMLRLHCDAGSRSGFQLFYPDRPGTRYGVTGPAPEVLTSSARAARCLHQGMAEILAGVHPSLGVAGDSATYVGSKQGALTGSIFSRVPTVTLEMGFLTQPRDERFLVSPRGQRKLVEAMVHGLEHFFREVSAGKRDPLAPEVLTSSP